MTGLDRAIREARSGLFAEVLRVLRDLPPDRRASAFEIADKIYRNAHDGGPQNGDVCIRVTINRHRASLAPYGYRLRSVHCGGYWLEPLT